VAKASRTRHQHDAVDRRHAGAADHFHHHDSEPDACGEDRQSAAAAAEFHAAAAAPEVINLSIDFDGTLLWNKTPVDRATLQGYISRKR
jgi:hypothetical protein